MDPARTAPAAYHRLQGEDRSVFVRDDADAVIEALGFASGEGRHADGVLIGGGRSAHPRHTLPDGSRWIWKRCRRGGLAARILRDRYLSVGRFLRELEVHERARAAGIPVSDLVALAITRTAPGTHRVEQLIRFENDVVDFATFLGLATSDDPPDPDTRLAAHRAVGVAIGRFHAAGLLHGDLNLRNILVRVSALAPDDDPRPAVILIDLDPAPRSRVRAHSAEGNLRRLFRSWDRFLARAGLRLSDDERDAFLEGYTAGGAPADPAHAAALSGWSGVRDAEARR